MEVRSDVELCRVTVVAARTRMDLALPVDANLADLLPTLLRHAGEDPEGEGFLSGGWVLQRVGEAPLDAGRRLSALGVRDGDILHLRHRNSALPEIAVDDVAEAVAGRRGVPWTADRTRAAAIIVAGVLALLAVVELGFAGPPWTLPAVVLLGVTALFTGAAVALAHAYAASFAGVVSIAVAAAAGLAGGAALVAGPHDLVDVGAPGLLVGAAVVLMVSVVGVLAVGPGRAAFCSAALGAGVVVVAAGVTTLDLASRPRRRRRDRGVPDGSRAAPARARGPARRAAAATGSCVGGRPPAGRGPAARDQASSARPGPPTGCSPP